MTLNSKYSKRIFMCSRLKQVSCWLHVRQPSYSVFFTPSNQTRWAYKIASAIYPTVCVVICSIARAIYPTSVLSFVALPVPSIPWSVLSFVALPIPYHGWLSIYTPQGPPPKGVIQRGLYWDLPQGVMWLFNCHYSWSRNFCGYNFAVVARPQN